MNFCKASCPDLPGIIWEAVQRRIASSVAVLPHLLRLHFHDCFVRGCDASVLLIDGAKRIDPEKLAEPNRSLEGFQEVELIKREVEDACPGVVSCSDTLALATRDLVYAAGGPYVKLRLGRKDGRISRAPEAVQALPPADSLDSVIDRFYWQNLNITDVVTLSGGHTVGDSHCSSTIGGNLLGLSPRNYISRIVNKDFRRALGSHCQLEGPLQEVNFDPITPIAFDNQYFKNILDGTGILATDLLLAQDRRTQSIVKAFAQDQDAFFEQWKVSWFKMSEINVLTGAQGEVRRNCSFPNAMLAQEEAKGFELEGDDGSFNISAN